MTRTREAVHTECDAWGEPRVQAVVDANVDDPERLFRLEWLNHRTRDRQSSDAQEWQAIPADIRRALATVWDTGMPPMASALYSRWWQLESWLRSLVYVELQAAFGNSWVDHLPDVSDTRQRGEDKLRYMKTPDAQDRLAYTDASALFQITLDHWRLFKTYLPSEGVWKGRIEELKAIRNRIGHCRRPHADDLARLEQNLRDLEGGALSALDAFNSQPRVPESWNDPLVDAWVKMQHNTASRLINHADRQYATNFELRCSRRPWAEPFLGRHSIGGAEGYFWHAFWYFRQGRPFYLDRFWRDIEVYRNDIIMLCADSPSSISLCFSVRADQATIADIIGRSFDAALFSIGDGIAPDYLQWRADYAALDPLVHAGTPWASIDKSMHGISIFGAWLNSRTL